LHLWREDTASVVAGEHLRAAHSLWWWRYSERSRPPFASPTRCVLLARKLPGSRQASLWHVPQREARSSVSPIFTFRRASPCSPCGPAPGLASRQAPATSLAHMPGAGKEFGTAQREARSPASPVLASRRASPCLPLRPARGLASKQAAYTRGEHVAGLHRGGSSLRGVRRRLSHWAGSPCPAPHLARP
jgi:hypothetical protein